MKRITPPQFDGITRMSATELNSIRFSTKRTILTPQVLAAITRRRANSAPARGGVSSPA